MIGETIGPYQVLAKLGEGGMGEVYRARDTKLDRDVALKVMSEQFTADPDRLLRFEREAKVLASLNHPNIAQVYGVEERALVMELVEGEDLKDRIDRGPIPLEEALAIARQIADALEAAHDAGTVHRDLKPANIKLRDDGTVKVLDFGLAKVLDPIAEASPETANSPTLTARATQLGMILGTAAYMAPEQAKGKSVDKRADTFAFGAVLFEMLTGRRAFDGDDVSDVMASVLKSDPDWNALPEDTPPAVRRLLRRCLEKDAKRRLRDIGEGMRQLDDAAAAPALGEAPLAGPHAPAQPLWRRVLPVTAAVVVTTLAVSALAWFGGTVAGPAYVTRFTTPADLGFTGADREIAISPNGRHVVYFNTGAGLYVRALDELEGVPVRGADLAIDPFVSPDNELVGFVDINGLSRLSQVSIFGGPKTLIAESRRTIFGADWGRDHFIVFGTGQGLFRVPDGGGEPEQISTVAEGELGHLWPAIVEDAGAVLFTISTQSTIDGKSLAVLSLDSGNVTTLGIAGTNPQYLSTGHLAYVTEDGALRAVPFDLDTLTVVGNPVPLVDGVQVKNSGAANFSVSDDGTLVYVIGTAGAANTLAWVDRAGTETGVSAEPRAYFYPRLSPDGSQAAIDTRDGENDIWIWNFSLESLRRLTFSASTDQYPVWTPDGQRIVFSSNRDGSTRPYVRNADGTGNADPIGSTDGPNQWTNAMVPDGAAVITRLSGENDDLGRVPMDGSAAETLLATPFSERNASISPNGRWLAFESDASNDWQVFVRPYPDVESGSWQVSTSGGRYPLWSPDGTELFYLDSSDTMMSVPVETESTFAHRAPRRLFDASGYFFGAPGRNFDIAPDGRFLMIKPQSNSNAESGPVGFIVVLNWLQDVRDRAARR